MAIDFFIHRKVGMWGMVVNAPQFLKKI